MQTWPRIWQPFVAAAILAVVFPVRADEESDVSALLAAGRSTPLLVAHRGISARFPENTMAAFGAAADEGALMLELDVGLSADGALVVLHDATLDRTTSGQGPLSQLPLDRLQGLDAGSWFDPRFASERLPTLQQVFERFGERIAINVEIKPEAVSSSSEGGIEEQVVALVRRQQLQSRVVVSSFEPAAVARVKRMAPEIRAAVLYHHEIEFDPVQLATLFRADGLHLNKRHVTAAVVDELHAAGLYAGVYTANEREDLRRLAGMGVDAIFTDDVVVARALLQDEED